MDQKVCGSCQRIFKAEKDFLENTSQWRVCSSDNLWFNCSCGSTLMLPKGKFSWYSPTLGMSPAAATIFNRMAETKQLPHIPSAVMELQKLLADPEIEIASLARTTKKDPLLATEVIRVADNLRKIRQGSKSVPNESIEYAITFIGRKHLGNLVMAASIRTFDISTKLFSQETFWHQSFQTAALAELLAAKFCPNVEKDKAYLAGSLCNIGKIVAALYYPEKTDEVAAMVGDVATQCTWISAERKIGLPDHCILGEIGSAFWGLAPFVSDVVKFHHRPPDDGRDNIELCHIACLANYLMHWLNLEPHRIDEAQLKVELDYFSITQKQVEKILEEAKRVVPTP